MSVDDDKRALRRRVRAERAGVPASARERADEQIASNAADLITRTGAQTIACYLPAPTEPPTRGVLAWAAEHGIRVLLPVSLDDGILDWAEPGEERASSLGVPEPTGTRLGRDAIASADLLFIPAAAIARDGTRLGWGRGYYDRALAQLAPGIPVYAVIYDAEVVDSVPHDTHDMPVTGIVTPTRILSFGR